MMLAWLVAAALAASDGEPPIRGWNELDEGGRQRQLELLKPHPLADRLVQSSAGFIGVRYAESPLGEGEGLDPDPLLRFDAVDCLTFVEEAMAMSLVDQSSELEGLLSELRYGQRVTYQDRNHLMEADWLPNNVRKGFLRDVTRQYGGDRVREEIKELTSRTWASKTSSNLKLSPARQVVGKFVLQVIPLDRVMEMVRQVPSGTVMLVVREERALLPTRISHLGFVVQKKRPHLRHASRTFGRVVDEDLESFLLRNQRYQKWPVVGVSLFEVLQPRLSAAP